MTILEMISRNKALLSQYDTEKKASDDKIAKLTADIAKSKENVARIYQEMEYATAHARM